jgi:glycosyltransferase involved in cell wall biosynthesis
MRCLRGISSLSWETRSTLPSSRAAAKAPRERVIDNIPRNASCLDHIHVAASPKWVASVREEERCRIEGETFAYAALKPLLEGDFDVIHCLEREVCNIIHDKRYLFRKTPKILFSNGGAIPARDLPSCDFVQEHTELNLSYSAKGKSFLIPHGVDVGAFHPDVVSDFRAQHGIPRDAFVVISVGAVSYGHKRMDYVVREVAAIKDAYLLVVGQETRDTARDQSAWEAPDGRQDHFHQSSTLGLAEGLRGCQCVHPGLRFRNFRHCVHRSDGHGVARDLYQSQEPACACQGGNFHRREPSQAL